MESKQPYDRYIWKFENVEKLGEIRATVGMEKR
jgi:hypothetical protein